MDWKAFSDGMSEISKERRAGNRSNSAAILRERGIAFECCNDGAHLIVQHAGKITDFWPGTGKYCVRGSGKYKRGVFNMLRDLDSPAE